MSTYQILLQDEDVVYDCSRQQNLLEGMAMLGKEAIPVGCRGGGCGVCKVKVLQGEYHCLKMSRAHISEEEQENGYVLACRCRPVSDLVLQVVGKIKTTFN